MHDLNLENPLLLKRGFYIFQQALSRNRYCIGTKKPNLFRDSVFDFGLYLQKCAQILVAAVRFELTTLRV